MHHKTEIQPQPGIQELTEAELQQVSGGAHFVVVRAAAYLIVKGLEWLAGNMNDAPSTPPGNGGHSGTGQRPL
jgi:bacteriocin-like protein